MRNTERSARAWWSSAGGRCRSPTLRARSRSTWRVGVERSCSTSRTSAPSVSRATTPSTVCSRPSRTIWTKIEAGRAQYTHLLDAADASVVDDIIIWWRPDDPQAFDVMPNASNTDGVRAAVGGADTTRERAVIAIQGPDAKALVSTVLPAAGSVGRFRVACSRLERRPVHRGRNGLHRRGRTRDCPSRRGGSRVCGERLPTPVFLLRAWAPVTRCVWKLRSHCMATSSVRESRRCRPASAGWSGGASRTSSGAPRRLQNAIDGIERRLMGIVTEGRRPARAGCAISIDGVVVGEVTSGNFSPVLGHGIALGFLPPDTPEGTAVIVDVRGKDLLGRVASTPFVGR